MCCKGYPGPWAVGNWSIFYPYSSVGNSFTQVNNTSPGISAGRNLFFCFAFLFGPNRFEALQGMSVKKKSRRCSNNWLWLRRRQMPKSHLTPKVDPNSYAEINNYKATPPFFLHFYRTKVETPITPCFGDSNSLHTCYVSPLPSDWWRCVFFFPAKLDL